MTAQFDIPRGPFFSAWLWLGHRVRRWWPVILLMLGTAGLVLWRHFQWVAVLALSFVLCGCHIVPRTKSIPRLPHAPSDGTGSYDALITMAHQAYKPGLGMILLSVICAAGGYWLEPLKGASKILWHAGIVFVLIGISIATGPWVLENFGRPVAYISVALATCVAIFWLWWHKDKLKA